MNAFQRRLGAALAGGLVLALSGCGASGDLSSVPQNYADRHSVECTLQYSVTFDANIGGVDFDDLRQDFIADAEVDLAGGSFYLLGTMETSVGGRVRGDTEVETYGVSGGGGTASYYRYGQAYSSDELDNSFLTIINAPLSLNLSSGYEMEASSEVLYGNPCDVYTGTEIADDTDQTFVSAMTEGVFSMEGCIIDVTLRIYQDTALPASLELVYSNLDEMDVSFSDEAGNSYTITELSYEIIYSEYDSDVSIEVPDEFRAAALNGQGADTADAGGVLGHGEDPISGGELDGILDGGVPSEAAPEETGGSYRIYNSAMSCSYEIGTPEYMLLDEAEEDYVSFYYYYDENDIELIQYTLYEDFTVQDETGYAEELPDLYRDAEGVSNVSASGIQSITVNGYDVQYTIIYLTLDDGGNVYEVMDIYSWVAAPNGRDSLEVDIMEYNGIGDGLFIDPESELEYAYGSVLGYNEH